MRKNLKKKHSFQTEMTNLANFAKNPYSFIVKSRSPKGQLCRNIKKGDICFCGHKIEQHLEKGDTLSCESQDCSCVSFCYLPSISIKCICKHSPLRHDPISRQCNQCTRCLGFVTNWTCNCGSKLLEHSCTKQKLDNSSAIQYQSSSNLPNLKKQNGKDNLSMSVLPIIKKPKGIINYPKSDSIKQNLSLSHISKSNKVRYANVFVQKQNEQNPYLKEKLRQANLRYFARFKQLQNSRSQQNEPINENTAMNLFVQPHYYRNCSLTALNHKLMQQP